MNDDPQPEKDRESDPDQADVATCAAMAARRDIRDLKALCDLADQEGPGYSDERLEELGFILEPTRSLRHQAGLLIAEKPVAIETKVTFEVTLATAAPERRLRLECEVRVPRTREPGRLAEADAFEVRRAFYAYRWHASAEIELTGAERETAEDFAARVIPELAR